MKIAISSTGTGIENEVSDVFGRCLCFVIVKIENNQITEFETVKNEATDQNGGAGVLIAQLLVKKGAEVIITGTIGPRALDILNQSGIEIYSAQGNIKEILQEFIKGKLKKIS